MKAHHSNDTDDDENIDCKDFDYKDSDHKDSGHKGHNVNDKKKVKVIKSEPSGTEYKKVKKEVDAKDVKKVKSEVKYERFLTANCLKCDKSFPTRMDLSMDMVKVHKNGET